MQKLKGQGKIYFSVEVSSGTLEDIFTVETVSEPRMTKNKDRANERSISFKVC
jgi:hypothetical protein